MITYIGSLNKDGSIFDYRTHIGIEDLNLQEGEMVLPVKYLDLHNPSEIFIKDGVPYDSDENELHFMPPSYQKIKGSSLVIQQEWLLDKMGLLFMGTTYPLLLEPKLYFTDIDRNYGDALTAPTVPVHLLPISNQTPIVIEDEATVAILSKKYGEMRQLQADCELYFLSFMSKEVENLDIKPLLESMAEYR